MERGRPNGEFVCELAILRRSVRICGCSPVLRVAFNYCPKRAIILINRFLGRLGLTIG